MKGLALTLALAPVLVRSATIPANSDINLIFHVDKASGTSSLDVSNADESLQFARSCNNVTLTGDGFENHPISFAVDNHGFGSFKLGDQTYTITDNAARSGGAICGALDSSAEVIISCTVAAPKELSDALRSHRPAADLPNCFGDRTVQLDKILLGFKSDYGVPDVVHQGTEQGIEIADSDEQNSPAARIPDCFLYYFADPVGNGNPHQNPMNVQLSDPIHCENGGCSVGETGSTSYTVGWTASKTTTWITAGFSVSRSITTGNSYTCSGGAYDVLALWKNQAQTAYTVQNYVGNTCGGVHPSGDPVIIWSPNSDGRGSYYYCVHGAGYVRNKGDRWLDTNPNHPGGPP